MYFDRSGQPIDVMRWADLYEDRSYTFVAQDNIDGVLVTTIWMGLDPSGSGVDPRQLLGLADHLLDGNDTAMKQWGDEHAQPVGVNQTAEIFETAVRRKEKGGWEITKRYRTESAALAGHAEIVKSIKAELGR